QVGRALDEKKEEDRKLLRRLRYVETANNSHMEVYAVLDENGVEQEWRSKVVSTFDAYERKRQKKSVVQRDFGPGTRFLFSLALNEVVAAKDGELLVVAGISQGIELECKRINDGRSADRRKKDKTRVRFTSTTGNFMPKGFRKMRIDVLGNVFPANE
ncbi:MAG: hypothetical protein IJ991_18065, partial [Thermoguttaceae bacterium]|nr:hypothetical protein [Thermoguttaceae bacterium]